MIIMPKFNIIEKIFEQFGYTKQVGSNNTVNNYYAPINNTIGDPNALLGEPPKPQKTYYIEGRDLLGLGEEKIKKCGGFLEDFYEKIYKKSHRTLGTTKNPYNMIQGAIFAVGSQKDNIEWKRHSSASLREIIYVWVHIKKNISKDFSDSYKKDSDSGGISDNERESLNMLTKYYGYFSAIHHNDEVGILNSLKSLEKEAVLEIDDCLKTVMFIKQVKGFLDEIYNLSTVLNKK